MVIVDVEGALAALASELGQAECPSQSFAVIPRLEGEDGVEPGFRHLVMDNGIKWVIEKDAGADAGEGPESVSRHRATAEEFLNGLAKLLFQLEIDAFEAGGGAPHLGQLIGVWFGDRLALGRHQHRAQAIEERVLQLQIESA